ncbi:DUF969 family protein, partial [Escherichia coli]|nr:DUF969 family protein [Escherichia coli]
VLVVIISGIVTGVAAHMPIATILEKLGEGFLNTRNLPFILLLPLAVAPAARNDKPVSLVIDDAPVAQVLQALAEMNHKNLVVAPDVSGTLSLRLQKVPWSQALRAVADSAGLSLQQQGTV